MAWSASHLERGPHGQHEHRHGAAHRRRGSTQHGDSKAPGRQRRLASCCCCRCPSVWCHRCDADAGHMAGRGVTIRECAARRQAARGCVAREVRSRDVSSSWAQAAARTQDSGTTHARARTALSAAARRTPPSAPCGRGGLRRHVGEHKACLGRPLPPCAPNEGAPIKRRDPSSCRWQGCRCDTAARRPSATEALCRRGSEPFEALSRRRRAECALRPCSQQQHAPSSASASRPSACVRPSLVALWRCRQSRQRHSRRQSCAL